MTHPAKDLLIAIAEGKQMEYLKPPKWSVCTPKEALDWIAEGWHNNVRIARPMVERTVRYPEPLRVKPEIGDRYWVPFPYRDTPTLFLWSEGQENYRIFNAGMAFATEADAAEAHKALFGGGV